jgi:hypothetical protein
VVPDIQIERAADIPAGDRGGKVRRDVDLGESLASEADRGGIDEPFDEPSVCNTGRDEADHDQRSKLLQRQEVSGAVVYGARQARTFILETKRA